MFDPTDRPRIYGLPPGADFPAELAAGILERTKGQPPEALARVTILVNTRRMQRRLKTLLSEGPARLLPRISLVTDIGDLMPGLDLPPPGSSLRRRLELARLVEALIASDPGLAPKSAKFDLADSLAALMDEMQGEDVPLARLRGLDISDQSGHWARSLKFLSIVGQYIGQTQDRWSDPEARRRRAAALLTAAWAKNPPETPIIVAGSTGSRATTALIMRAVAALPQGAVVLPGFDFHTPGEVWRELTDSGAAPLGAQDHPQYRFAAFLESLGADPMSVEAWRGDKHGSARNALVSLSLRPAPVTDRWLSEGPDLGDLLQHTSGLTMIEASQPRDEALAIAVAIREAIEHGKSVALISPDRVLGRRVAAALSRWNIVADDSAGQPLALTAPGRFLRQVAGLIEGAGDSVELMSLLKHPLAHSAGSDRGQHLRLTREFELYLRGTKSVSVTKQGLNTFRDRRPDVERPWCDWLGGWLDRVASAPEATLEACLEHHLTIAEALAGGGPEGSGGLWERTAGRDALRVMERMRAEGDFDHPMNFADYRQLFEHVLAGESSRDYETARTDVMIWGTLEARVQGADLVILGGLNEGAWPERPAADPWLNRPLRKQAGLLLPERQIGLAAHDYQQAIAAGEVILSRARRDEESETVPSRWLGRLANLLEGLKDQNGPEALKAMCARGQAYLDHAAGLDLPKASVSSESRPAPAPARAIRPKSLSVTEIQTLIRDPYAIYAKYILKLRRLDPLRVEADARLRGDLFHDIAEAALEPGADFSDPAAAIERMKAIARAEFGKLVWPGVRALWSGHFNAIVEHLVAEEKLRRLGGAPIALERKGRFDVPGTSIAIRGKADRIDRLSDGRLAIYDYKTGKPPDAKQVRYFDRQLLIEAVMADLGGFEELPSAEVAFVAHIGLGRTPATSTHLLVEGADADFRIETITAELARLLNAFDTDAKGYPSRRAMEKVRFDGDYDHLARFGEWDETMDPVTERLP